MLFRMENSLTVSLVLASNSPRRRELLRLTGWAFRVQVANIDETILPGEGPQEYVLRLAQEKATKIAQDSVPGEIVLAADTTVVEAGDILGKPSQAEDAARMLRRLRGHVHQVITALAVLRAQDGCMVTEVCVSDVPMRAYSDLEIEAYVASGDPLDKAGAYGIQNQDFHPVDSMHGCFASVMGLPMCHLVRALRRLGLENDVLARADAQTDAGVDIPSACRSALGYKCDYYPLVLNSIAG